jgi:hypothetical protein
MDIFSISFAVVSLLLQVSDLYEKVRSHSADFHRLDEDLKSFHEALVLTERYLQYLHHTRRACEQIAQEIERLLSKRKRQRGLKRVVCGVSPDKIQHLRSRMQLHITFLHHCAE